MDTTEIGIRPPRTMTEVYQCLPEGTPVQLIENKLIMAPSPFTIHQKLVGQLFSSLNNYVATEKKGQVFLAPLDVYLDSGNIYQPDIFFISNEHIHNLKENGFHGAPDLVIEILLPSTAQYDLKDKKKVYERNGVKEYWIIDPHYKSAQGFYLKDVKYQSFHKAENVLKSRLLEVSISF
ncbi:MAG: Uma2 family endonuclease [Chitinophagaceae bacterium]